MKSIKNSLSLALILSHRGFTLVELMVIVAIVGMSAVISLQFARSSNQNAALRRAALELVAYIEAARELSETNRVGCALSINADNALVLPDVAVNPNGCAARPALSLSEESGLQNLSLSGSTSITFAPRGLNINEATIYLSVPGEISQMCVFVSSPAALVKRGFRNGNSGECNYISAY